MHFAALLVPLIAFQAGGKLQIKDVKVGTGPAAKAGDALTMDYTGKLTSGKVFDSSVGKTPFNFVLGQGQVIQGWDKGILGMKVGGKRILTIPAAMGYGAQGSPPVIPPNATLVFVVELRKIDGITVQTLKPGRGAGVKNGDTIKVHYKGMLKDGTKFDSSYERNEPFDVTIGKTGLIPGFTQGLLGMKLGEKRKVTIPPALGYGARSVGPIPANSTLVFELELVKVGE